ncbi:hypothetical protein [Alkalimarinus alittae]|uniref:RDD domain-containing protein n=1 Tax=Alkalimarinus alittae TaxID=2961619 RepID=A0ABY6N5E2_9ALTE|nr:hypothetical protein [Alkalimarinus alittae]UZE97255.1 hypothetical protein NKI27_05760 [Alkalimarinus alittae]
MTFFSLFLGALICFFFTSLLAKVFEYGFAFGDKSVGATLRYGPAILKKTLKLSLNLLVICLGFLLGMTKKIGHKLNRDGDVIITELNTSPEELLRDVNQKIINPHRRSPVLIEYPSQQNK